MAHVYKANLRPHRPVADSLWSVHHAFILFINETTTAKDGNGTVADRRGATAGQ